jgi:hypothetical protein
MFLSIPFVAILKIVFDRIDELRPWGKLLGDETPQDAKRRGKFWKRNKESVSEEMIKRV